MTPITQIVNDTRAKLKTTKYVYVSPRKGETLERLHRNLSAAARRGLYWRYAKGRNELLVWI